MSGRIHQGLSDVLRHQSPESLYDLRKGSEVFSVRFRLCNFQIELTEKLTS